MSDLRYAIRFLWTHKPFGAAAILTLAIRLGANTALYGILNATLRPLPLPNPDQLVVIAAEPKGDETGGFQFSEVVGFMPRIGGLLIDGKPTLSFAKTVRGDPGGGAADARRWQRGSCLHVAFDIGVAPRLSAASMTRREDYAVGRR